MEVESSQPGYVDAKYPKCAAYLRVYVENYRMEKTPAPPKTPPKYTVRKRLGLRKYICPEKKK